MALVDDLGDSRVTVKKDDLLKALRENRATHRGTFEAAQAGYREQVIKELDAMLADARAGRQIRRAISLVEPHEHTKDYDRVIRMLEMSTAEEITISESQFQSYVMDDWGWKQQFSTVAMAYSK